MSAMLAKSYCSEVFNKIAGDNIQVHGGIGFTEHPVHLFLKSKVCSSTRCSKIIKFIQKNFKILNIIGILVSEKI